METSVTEEGIPNITSRKSRLALAHNLAASLLSPAPAPDDANDDDVDEDAAAFPNEKDGVAEEGGAGADDDDKLCPNENGADGAAAAAVVDGAAGAALAPNENPVSPAAGAGADVVVGLLPNEKEGADVPLVRSTLAKGFALTGASSPPFPFAFGLGAVNPNDADDGGLRAIFKVLRLLRTSSDAREKACEASPPSAESKRSFSSFVS
jgi:hypothetical protein